MLAYILSFLLSICLIHFNFAIFPWIIFVIIKKIHILYLFRGGVLIYAVHCIYICICVCVCAHQGDFTSGMLLLYSVPLRQRSVRFQWYLNVIQCDCLGGHFTDIYFLHILFYFQEATHSSMNIRRKILSLNDLQTCSLLQLNALRASLNEDIQGIFFLSDTICSHWTAAMTFSVNNTTHKCHAVFMLL